MNDYYDYCIQCGEKTDAFRHHGWFGFDRNHYFQRPTQTDLEESQKRFTRSLDNFNKELGIIDKDLLEAEVQLTKKTLEKAEKKLIDYNKFKRELE
ncbi:MAG: hypothetical protein ACREBR_04785 [bacterium]